MEIERLIEKFLDRIICGDALEILKQLPDNSVDVGVTSPPYNKGERDRGWLVDRVVYDTASDNMPEEKYQKWQIDVLNELYRVIKEGGSFFYNHKIRWKRGEMIHPMDWLRKTKWVIRQEIIWDRMIAANIRGWRFWQVDERIYWLYKPRGTQKGKNLIGEELKSRHAMLTSIWRFPPERNNEHPAPFPLALPLRCIYSVLDERKGCVVIDPFAGSGTTCVAAKILGHHYIGIEISQQYVKLAEERLKRYEREMDIAREELAKHTVEKTFKERKRRGEFVGKYRPIENLTIFEFERENEK